jgi:hypothetical protein
MHPYFSFIVQIASPHVIFRSFISPLEIEIWLPSNCILKWNIFLGTFPHVFLELTDTEVANYFKPSDLMIGKTVNIYGRNFLIYDCDMFTKTFYSKNFGVNNFEPINTEAARNAFAKMVKFHLVFCLIFKRQTYYFRKFLHIMDLVHWKIHYKIVYVFNLIDQKKIMLN